MSEDVVEHFIIPSNAQLEEYECDYTEPTRKFNLVLDLDQTLIHTILTTDYDVVRRYCTSKNLLVHFVNESQDPEKSDTHFLVFYRPGVLEFLEIMSQLFIIHIYTNAVSSYANRIISTIHQSLGSVVIKSYHYRPENSSYLQKHLSNITPFTNDTIVIDDRLDVWLEDMKNVIRIREFLGPTGPSPYLEDVELYYLIPIIIKMREIAISEHIPLVSLVDGAREEYSMAHLDDILAECDRPPSTPKPGIVDFLRIGAVSSSF